MRTSEKLLFFWCCVCVWLFQVCNENDWFCVYHTNWTARVDCQNRTDYTVCSNMLVRWMVSKANLATHNVSLTRSCSPFLPFHVCKHASLRSFCPRARSWYTLHSSAICTWCGACSCVCETNRVCDFIFQPVRCQSMLVYGKLLYKQQQRRVCNWKCIYIYTHWLWSVNESWIQINI